jgi:hypothetical protein
MQVPHKSRRIPASIKIAIGGALAIGAVLGGWRLYSSESLKNFELTAVAPGRVNLVAVRPGAGWRIIVSNSMAQLAETTGMGHGDADRDEDVQNGKRLPMREYIDTLRGNQESLGYLVEKLADITDESIPLGAPHWTVENLEKAFKGDPVLTKKLEHDLQCRLDGGPIGDLSISAILNGIVIDVPVSVTIQIDGKPQKVTGIVRSPYMSDLAEVVAKQFNSKFDPKPEFVMGVYKDAGMRILNGEVGRENVIKAIQSRYHPGRVSSLAEKPQELIKNSTVLVTDSHLESASMDKYSSGNKSYADITLNLTHEGKMRLWKYSFEHPGFQLLLVVDGLAYAAPRISGQLVESHLQITHLTEPDLAQEAVDRINEIEKEPKS